MSANKGNKYVILVFPQYDMLEDDVIVFIDMRLLMNTTKIQPQQ